LTSVHHSSRLLAKVAGAGLDPHLALEGSGISLEAIHDLTTRIKITDEYAIYRNVLALLPDSGISVDIGLNARVSVYGMLGYLLLTAATLSDALKAAADVPALIANGFSMSLETSNDLARLCFSDYSGAADLRFEYAEVALGSFKRTCSDILGQDLPLTRVGFEGACTQTCIERCAGQFGCPVVSGQTQSFLEFPASFLDVVLPLADPISHLEVLELCRRQNSEFAAEREWLQQVRDIISKTLAEPVPLEDIADRLHCSSRTLRRRLGELKTNYRQLLDDVRFEKAKLMLKEGRLQTDEIAEKLGFCDGAGFRRAFQRWSGQPPGAYKT